MPAEYAVRAVPITESDMMVFLRELDHVKGSSNGRMLGGSGRSDPFPSPAESSRTGRGRMVS